ncbi:uncharacterized protein METZ01_LOCUS148291, partial [marine metagenome]
TRNQERYCEVNKEIFVANGKTKQKSLLQVTILYRKTHLMRLVQH